MGIRMKVECLRCRWFKMDNIHSGVCRRLKGKNAPRPMVKDVDTCSDWQDAGPQFHIRVGWIKNQKKQNTSN